MFPLVLHKFSTGLGCVVRFIYGILDHKRGRDGRFGVRYVEHRTPNRVKVLPISEVKARAGRAVARVRGSEGLVRAIVDLA